MSILCLRALMASWCDTSSLNDICRSVDASIGGFTRQKFTMQTRSHANRSWPDVILRVKTIKHMSDAVISLVTLNLMQ
jgi:hypothetical protein